MVKHKILVAVILSLLAVGLCLFGIILYPWMQNSEVANLGGTTEPTQQLYGSLWNFILGQAQLFFIAIGFLILAFTLGSFYLSWQLFKWLVRKAMK